MTKQKHMLSLPAAEVSLVEELDEIVLSYSEDCELTVLVAELVEDRQRP